MKELKSDPTEEPREEIKLKSGAPQHKLTREDQSKGGKTRTLRREMSDQFKVRKYCDESCPIFEDCWTKPLVYADAKYKHDSGRYLCALKGFSKRLQQATIKLFTKGEKGINDLMKDVVIRVLTKVSIDDVKELRRLLRDLGYVKDKLYGSKQRTEVSGKLDLTKAWMEAVKETEQEMQEESAAANTGAVDNTKETNT